jgi:hypothetical protein
MALDSNASSINILHTAGRFFLNFLRWRAEVSVVPAELSADRFNFPDRFFGLVNR